MRSRVQNDFTLMRGGGINAIRTYHVPPEWLFRLAEEQEMVVLVGMPWADVPCHFDFLESRRIRREARQSVRQAAQLGRRHTCVLAYSIGNEIPPDILRWHGVRRVECFLAELRDVIKQADPEGLVTYASYPPSEYLDSSFLDFTTFNVYLHDRDTFRNYLFRLQNLVGDKPLLLGELGMDTLRHGEQEQTRFLVGHVREAVLMGLAGTFLFSWTDDWHRGGSQIEDWAFGITTADRRPKASYHALREVFADSPGALLPETPRVSVIVCTYNGGRTLDQCLRSLLALDYPDYEVIVVDDGSTDNTRAIVSRFPGVRTIHQANQGLSIARNVGLWEATGAIVAYTDSDCFADPDWLTHLIYQLQRSGAAAVGGPNLTPEDGWLAACVAASPGQPTHVLEGDQVAEHIPGCNMAFRREALLAINGFDPQYHKAGDDVDICWRLQQAGLWITFAPGAFVWHHRRQNPRAYFRQQVGYGEAETLLQSKHPDKFNGRGDGKWRGVLYGASLRGVRIGEAIIYRGTFSAGFFQCLYQPGTAHWAMLPSTLEWHLAIALFGLMAVVWSPARILVAGMLGLSLAIAALQAAQARIAPQHEGFRSRLLIMALCYAQPLVRSWWRYQTRLISYSAPTIDPALRGGRRVQLPLTGRRTVWYWTEEGHDRVELLGQVTTYLAEHRWGKALDSGWSDWDLEIYCYPGTIVRVCTAQEDYGGNKRHIRVRYRLRPSGSMRAVGIAAVLSAAIAIGSRSWPVALGALALLAVGAGLWWYGVHRASQVIAIVDTLASRMRAVRYGPGRGQGERAKVRWWERKKVDADQ